MTTCCPTADCRASDRGGYLGDAPDHRHLACEIFALLPLLRAIARVRCATRAEADALLRATVQQALAAVPQDVPAGDLRPWLLGLQRAIYEAQGAWQQAAGDVDVDLPTRGIGATWQCLQVALLRLSDRQREALLLADGAYLTLGDLAAIFRTAPDHARQLVRHARGALLARLDTAQPKSWPPPRPAGPRRQAGLPRPWRRNANRPVGPGSSPRCPKVELADERRAFAGRLNSALYRALWQDAADPAERRGFETLLAREAPSSATRGISGTRGCRTSWLRLMFIAYACTANSSSGG